MSDVQLYDIDSLLEEVVTLPSLPDSLERITKLVNDPNCALGDVAKAISADPSIALKILRLVNSAFYGLGQEVATVEHAVVLLGVKVVKNLTMTATVFTTMQGSTKELLKHSLACAAAMRTLAEVAPLYKYIESPDEAFVFGLLHDIGKVVFEEYVPEYANVNLVVQERRIPWYSAEREVIGVDHATLGAQLARNWKLSDQIVHGIGGHHQLDQCPEDARVLAANLAIADYICSCCGLASHANPCFDIPEEAWALAEIKSKQLPEILEQFFASLQDVEELMSLAA